MQILEQKLKHNARSREKFAYSQKNIYLCTVARMAESVDATVSNTVGETHPGSIPGPGTVRLSL